MAGWTKEQYDTAYSIRIERYLGGHPPGRPEVRLNYHRYAIAPILAARWQTITPILGLSAADYVCVIGAGFGWGVEGLIAASGATVVGIDVSDYIAAEKDTTEETDIRANIVAVGLDPDSGRGLELMQEIYDGSPRASVVVLQNSASSANERQQIRTALGGNWPTVVVFEDIVDDSMADADIINARNAAGGFGGSQRIIWLYTPTPNRSAQSLATLTGNEVILPDGAVFNP